MGIKTGIAAATLAAGLATSALADATITVCTAGGECATDTVQLGRGDWESQCIDGEIVGKRISTLRGAPSFNDAMTVLWSMAAHAANEVTERGVQVTGVQARMDGCTGSWAPLCTEVTRGNVPTLGDFQSNANGIIRELTGQQPRGCGVFQNATRPLFAPGAGLR